MPEQMANDHNVQKIKLYTEKQIRVLSDIYEIMTCQRYVELRDAICSRLTLFNARYAMSYAAALGARAFTAKSNSTGTNCYANKDLQFQ